MTGIDIIGLIIIILGVWIIFKFHNKLNSKDQLFDNTYKDQNSENTIQKYSEILGRNTQGYDVDDFVKTLDDYVDYEEILNEFYATCLNQKNLKKIFAKYNCKKTDLEAEFILLSANGASCWEGGHYVVVSAFLNEYTLEYILRTWKENLSISERVFKIRDYFKNNKTGKL